MEIVHIDSIINLGVPHVVENIFASLETSDLIQCLKVSETWKVMAEKILHLKWKGKLLEACATGKTEITEILLDNLENSDKVNAINENINAKNKFGWTAFMGACGHGHKDVVKLLLNHKRCENIDVNAKTVYGETSLHWACSRNGDKDIVKLLLEHPRSENININARNNFGWTPFMVACGHGHKDVVKLLLDHPRSVNIDINAKNNLGESVYCVAKRRHPTEICNCLPALIKLPGAGSVPGGPPPPPPPPPPAGGPPPPPPPPGGGPPPLNL